MKVKTKITFVVEYPLETDFLKMDFYDKDEDVALKMEKTFVTDNPLWIIDAFAAKDSGSFTVEVEKAE